MPTPPPPPLAPTIMTYCYSDLSQHAPGDDKRDPAPKLSTHTSIQTPASSGSCSGAMDHPHLIDEQIQTTMSDAQPELVLKAPSPPSSLKDADNSYGLTPQVASNQGNGSTTPPTSPRSSQSTPRSSPLSSPVDERSTDFADGDDDGDENEDDMADVRTSTSTFKYDQEPFKLFRSRIVELVKCLWGDAAVHEITIKRMPGGGYNRVTGISRKLNDRQESQEYILRVPRMESRWQGSVKLDNDVAALQYVKNLNNIPVPEVIEWDATSGNKLERPYMMLSRLKGTSLQHAYGPLDHGGRCRVAQELGQVFAQMLAAGSNIAGEFQVPKSVPNGTKLDQIIIEPYPASWAPSKRSSVFAYRVLDFLNSSFNARIAECIEDIPDPKWKIEYYIQFLKMAAEMEADGWFRNIRLALCHLDLEYYNVLIDANAPVSSPIITGVLDWDFSGILPAFMACKPPQWIWGWEKDENDEDDDERSANGVPATEEDKALKQIFETAAGPDYMRYAYSPAYRMARRLVRFAIEREPWVCEDTEIDELLKEWTDTREQLRNTQVELNQTDHSSKMGDKASGSPRSSTGYVKVEPPSPKGPSKMRGVQKILEWFRGRSK